MNLAVPTQPARMEYSQTYVPPGAHEHFDPCDKLVQQVRRARMGGALFGEDSMELGVQIGRFRLLDVEGQGSAGVVFRARDAELGREVAVKVMRAGDGDAKERVRRESQALASLSHPNVVSIYDVGEHEGLVWVAMEYVVGMNLRAWVATLPGRAAVLDAYVQAGRGLAAAHDAGIVHRDFKPDNVLVGDDGRVRVADFGLAKPSGTSLAEPPEDWEAADSGSDLSRATLTQTGALVGTPAYMSPEQMLGLPVGPAGDQFSFCVSLFESLTGRRPFVGEDLASLMEAVSSDVRTPLAAQGVSSTLLKIVEKGIERDPNQRHASMRALAHALVNKKRVSVGLRAGLLAAAGVLALGATYAATRDTVAASADQDRGAPAARTLEAPAIVPSAPQRAAQPSAAQSLYGAGKSAYRAQQFALAAGLFDRTTSALVDEGADLSMTIAIDFNRALAYAHAAEQASGDLNAYLVAFVLHGRVAAAAAQGNGEYVPQDDGPRFMAILARVPVKIRDAAALRIVPGARIVLRRVVNPALDGVRVFANGDELCTAPCTLALTAHSDVELSFGSDIAEFDPVKLAVGSEPEQDALKEITATRHLGPKVSELKQASGEPYNCEAACQSLGQICSPGACDAKTSAQGSFGPNHAYVPHELWPTNCADPLPSRATYGEAATPFCCCIAAKPTR